VLRSLLTYGNLVLLRQADVLQLRHGLLRLRERAYDMSRLRGGTLRQPLLVRLVGDRDVVTGPLRGHGRRAATRRWTRALGLPVVIGVALALASVVAGKSV